MNSSTRIFPSWFHFFIESIQRRRGNYTLPDEIEGLVISPGGVASTSVMDHLAKYLTINDSGDRDGLKHRPRPPRSSRSDLRVMLIIGPTDEIITSLEARGYLPHQAIRLGSWLYFLAPPGQRPRLLAKAIANQRRWWEQSSYRVLVVHFDNLWTSKSKIAAMFDITDPKFLDEFPPRRQRNSRQS